jgi:hypothetical protein
MSRCGCTGPAGFEASEGDVRDLRCISAQPHTLFDTVRPVLRNAVVCARSQVVSVAAFQDDPDLTSSRNDTSIG